MRARKWDGKIPLSLEGAHMLCKRVPYEDADHIYVAMSRDVLAHLRNVCKDLGAHDLSPHRHLNGLNVAVIGGVNKLFTASEHDIRALGHEIRHIWCGAL